MIDVGELKAKLLELLKSDEEFRYAVAGLLGLSSILDELRKLREDFNKLYQKSLEHDRRFQEIREEIKKLYEKSLEHDKRFEVIEKTLETHSKRLEELSRAIQALGCR